MKIYELFEILFIIYVINYVMRNRWSLVVGLFVLMIGWNCLCNKIFKLKKIGVSISKIVKCIKYFLWLKNF